MSDAHHPQSSFQLELHGKQRLKRLGLLILVLALAVAAIGIALRYRHGSELQARAGDASVPVVAVVQPDGGGAGGEMVLPGNLEAFNSAAIYARTNGYVKSWQADIGDDVRAGQVLATLDAPEVLQQLAQARADYRTALANRRLAQTSAERWQAMLLRDAVSKQEVDERNGDFAARSAVADAALANVRRLEALEDFTRITAPFGGIVTSRSAQLGALVVSGNAAAQPLFTISDTHRMRIYVRVPQAASTQVQPGTKATMTLPEHPGRSFPATVTRTARAVDGRSGAVLVQLEATNPEGLLMPGSYAQVSFETQGLPGSFRLPGSAILVTNDGPAVAIVDQRGIVSIKPVKIDRDEGRTVMISTGLKATDRVIDTPPDSIEANDKVRIRPAEPAPEPANAPSQPQAPAQAK